MKKQIIIPNIRIILVILFTLVKIPVLLSQHHHEFSLHASGGLSALRYQLSLGDASKGFGGDFGAGYTYFRTRERVTDTEKIFNERWGIHTGMGLGLYNAKTQLDKKETISRDLRDSENHRFDLYSTFAGYKETQNTMFLNIPVMGLIQINEFYGMGGVKLGIPLNGRFKSKGATLTNKAHYIDFDNWAETQEFLGYGKFNQNNSAGKLELGVFVALSLEAGMKWVITDNISIYTGMYFDYGLNNVTKGSNQRFVDYSAGSGDHPENYSLTTNSVLSSYIDDSKSTTFTGKAKVIAAGISVRVAYVK